jgi:drug/metabolite transporter (DMT)-like permease
MHSQTSNLRGIALMVLATGMFTCNDTLLKLATEGMPQFQVLFLRGLFGSLLLLPLVLFSGHGRKLHYVLDKWVALRAGLEFVAVLFFIVALVNMPIADITAIGQISPMLLLIGVSLIYGEKLGAVRMVLIAFGFLGALLVAQPGGAGFTPYVFLGFASALGVVGRDIVGRKVSHGVPALVVAFATLVLVMAGSGIAMVLLEKWQMPDGGQLALVAGAGFFLSIGHLLLFLAYRVGATGAVAPFSYMLTIWAVISGIVVFHSVPNALAIAGMVLILASGVSVVLLDERHRRLSLLA